MAKKHEETDADLWECAVAVDTEEVWTDASGKDWPLWQVVTDFYEDETPVLAAGTEAWPMGQQEAEFIAETMKAAVGRRVLPHRSGGGDVFPPDENRTVKTA